MPSLLLLTTFLLNLNLSSFVTSIEVNLKPVVVNSSSQSGPIYFKPDGRCLDTNWMNTDVHFMLSVTPQNSCPKSAEDTQFTFEANGQVTVQNKGATRCLDCFLFFADCHIITYPCHSETNQKWFMRTYPRQIDYKHRKFTFSLHNVLHPTKCITGYHAYGNVKFEERYSRTSRLENVRKTSDGYYQGVHHGFRLEDCHGFDNQTFYFDPSEYEIDIVFDEKEITNYTTLTA
ncbi:hypothetical protein TYRP_003155 [Tyrophagus putrescentiae]|nr:hypothetical protein TYRP_003155 [Tyrophagus putrescentiae]